MSKTSSSYSFLAGFAKVLWAFAFLFIFSHGSFAADATSPYYIRLDGGLSASRDAGFKNNSCDPLGAPLCYLGPNGLNKIGNGALISGGIGFKILSFLRLEASIDNKSGYKLNETYTNAPTYWGTKTNVQSKISSFSGFATGYLDIAPLLKTDFGFFEPYIGFGLGMSQNSMKAGNLVDNSVPGAVFSATFSGANNSSFSYRLLVGTGIRITPNLAFDLGYRYSDYGRISVSNQQSSWSLNNVPVASPFAGFKGNLKSDEVTFGVRYNF